jgi:glycosyltransferase involved in cell wall biosynthesis
MEERGLEYMRLNSSPRVSILIPAKNASKTIGAALISAFITKPRGGEIVVLLDGNDTKSKVLDYFENLKSVRLYTSSKALGITGARNYLLSQAKSEIVSWLDADDVALPFRYGKTLRSIEKGRIDLSFSHSIIFGKRLRRVPFLPQFPFPISAELSPFFLWQGNPFVQSTMVARKSAIHAVGGYRD